MKAQRKEWALEKKKAKAEAGKEKAKLKREEHKMLLEKTHALLKRNPPSAAAGSAEVEQATATVEVPAGPPKERQSADLLETSLVESGAPLNLNTFPSEEEDADEPVGGNWYTRSTVETETMSQVTTEAYVHVPPEDVPTSTSAHKAGMKAPRKQPSSKIRPQPGTGSLNYTPSEKARRKAAQAGDILPPGEKTGSRYCAW